MAAQIDNGSNTIILQLAVSLAIGLLIGIERGWQQRNELSGSRVAGVRTFGILGLLGGVAGLLPILLALAIMLSGAATLVAGYVRQRRITSNVSATTILVGLLTLVLGYLATTGMVVPALAVAVAATLLLSMREQIHGWLKGITEAEIQAIGRFGLLSAVVLPLLPDAQYGPLDAWNPRRIWLVVVLVSGLSLAGYVATRRLGEKAGLLATAFTGSLVSSTAVTLALARRLKDGTADLSTVTAGIAIASVVMFGRVTILTLVLAPFAAGALVRLIAPAMIVALVLAALAWQRTQDGQVGEAKVGNPFDLRPAFVLATLVALIALAVRWGQIWFGDAGIAAMLALAGFADVDAAVMALSTLPRGSIGSDQAGLALAAPVLLNTALKGGIAIAGCADTRGVRAALPLFAAVAAACVSLAILYLG